jgi:hypothetical protein
VAERFWGGLGSVHALAPGLYRDAAGNIHLDVGQLLAYLGAADTPANRATVADHMVRQAQSRIPVVGEAP